MAKEKVSLPSSMGGLMRFDGGEGGLQISPGQVIIFTLIVSGFILMLRLLK
ncbi:MAG: preprotein translocase subunit Sec61beta [Candidatus Altiarchaeota archaeon]|nr:preprotein translocase subunit Sec61beta [Candidatus Altiarchaeota archaeon]